MLREHASPKIVPLHIARVAGRVRIHRELGNDLCIPRALSGFDQYERITESYHNLDGDR